eukprot:8220099-Lingulodinium_polyedra.AAC.1
MGYKRMATRRPVSPNYSPFRSTANAATTSYPTNTRTTTRLANAEQTPRSTHTESICRCRTMANLLEHMDGRAYP